LSPADKREQLQIIDFEPIVLMNSTETNANNRFSRKSLIMYSDTFAIGSDYESAWYCVRSHPKREHIAAAHLRLLDGVDVFNPRLRIRKATRRGVVTFVESLFPNYIFARFNPEFAFNNVRYAPSVSTIVHFGVRVTSVPDAVIEELRREFGEGEMIDCERHVAEGDIVTIGEGPFYGMTAKVLRVLTPHQRVEVLLEFLGRTTSAVVDPRTLVRESTI
jgi:transcriptional antiterminator RfaH